jgi:MFS family permease
MIGSVFYGIILNLAYSKGSFYITCFCSFAGEITGELSSGFLAGSLGRVKVLCMGCFLSGISMVFYTLLDSVVINYILIYFATLGIAGAFNVKFIYTPELYPTPIRGIICGYTYLLSRFGAMIVSPITSYFGAFTTNVLFACCSIATGIIISKMPETLGKELQNEIPELEGMNTLIDSAKSRLSKRFLLSEQLFKTSFIGHDPISFQHISCKNIGQLTHLGSGIFSRK